MEKVSTIVYEGESPSDKIARFRTIRKMINRATAEFLSKSLNEGKDLKEVEPKFIKSVLAKYLYRN